MHYKAPARHYIWKHKRWRDKVKIIQNTPNKINSKLQLTYMWFDRNLNCLSVIWNLILYLPEIWSKFKLPTYIWNPTIQVFRWIVFDLIWSCIFIFFVFLEKRDIKVEQNWIVNHVFNRSGLKNSNWANLKRDHVIHI